MGLGATSREVEKKRRKKKEREPRLDFEGGIVISFMLFHVDVSLERRERKKRGATGEATSCRFSLSLLSSRMYNQS